MMIRIWIDGGWAMMGPHGYAGQVVATPEGGKGVLKLGSRLVRWESDPDAAVLPDMSVYAIEWECYP